jgi:hypothetical protein
MLLKRATTVNEQKHKSKRKLRIQQLASHKIIRRGGAVQLVRLALELKRRGNEVTCAFNCSCLDYRKYPELQVLHDNGLAVARFHMSASGEKIRFRDWVLERDFDILHAHRDKALTFACQTLSGCRPPIVAGRGTIYRLKPFTGPGSFSARAK